MLDVSTAAALVAAVAGALYLWLATQRAVYPGVWSLPWQVQPDADRWAILKATVRLAILCCLPLLATMSSGSPPGRPLFDAMQAPPAAASAGTGPTGPTWLWLVFVAVGLVPAGYLASRLLFRRQPSLAPSVISRDVDQELAHAAASALDTLSIGADPRRAILAAYALMEGVLARRGLPRSPHETAPEFAGRVLRPGGPPEVPLQSLTDLFQLAAFSPHAVTERMRRRAMRSLRAISEATR